MAELPELTVYAELLGPRLAGRRIDEVAVHQPRVVRGAAPEAFVAAVTGRRVLEVIRSGKTLALPLETAPRLDVHLMLGGEPYWLEPGDDTRPPEPTLTLRLEGGARLVFSDHNFDLLKPGEAKMWVGLDRRERGGLDPLAPAYTPAALGSLCARNKLAPIKTVLCDQRLIAGLGNAYADEILWEARVKPRRTASLMTPDEIARVHAATEVTLAAATKALRERLAGKPLRGEPKRDFLRVHHRARKPCPRCRTPIRMETLRDRSTYWCPACQP
ncbi:MAG TPA: DNA-formamidopyrimidine glycosylase family protein [Methylomirabilota bacterium]|nr:DNA-formamidopyrimidine glycosylase family protein [Methylomirabilota bacterium]